MKQLKVTLVLGARPQIVKSAPFIHLANKDKEVNRRLTDHCSTLLFTPTENLRDTGLI